MDIRKCFSFWYYSKNVLSLFDQYNLDGKGTVIAVIDTGLVSNLLLYLEENNGLQRINSLRQFIIPGLENYRHGTHGSHVAYLIHTIAPKAKIMSIKAADDSLQGSKHNDLLKALEVCLDLHEKKGIPHIINISLGREPKRDDRGQYLRCQGDCNLAQMVNEAADKDIIVVACTGNSPPVQEYPVLCPGCAAGAITIGGVVTDPKDPKEEKIIMPPYSCRGDNRKPDFIAPSEIPSLSYSQLQHSPFFQPIILCENIEGTSFAAPFVSGCIALVRQALISKSRAADPNSIRKCLFDSCEQLPRFGRDMQGHGLINFQKVINKILP